MSAGVARDKSLQGVCGANSQAQRFALSHAHDVKEETMSQTAAKRYPIENPFLTLKRQLVSPVLSLIASYFSVNCSQFILHRLQLVQPGVCRANSISWHDCFVASLLAMTGSVLAMTIARLTRAFRTVTAPSSLFTANSRTANWYTPPPPPLDIQGWFFSFVSKIYTLHTGLRRLFAYAESFFAPPLERGKGRQADFAHLR
jgi:hypothetical protein